MLSGFNLPRGRAQVDRRNTKQDKSDWKRMKEEERKDGMEEVGLKEGGKEAKRE